MNRKMKISDAEVKQLAREILGQDPLRSESPDAVFLAGFRRKLANYKKPPETVFLNMARMSWKLAPITALATLVLGVGLILEQPYPRGLPEEPWERVLTEIADDANSEVSRDLLVEAVLLGSGSR